MVLAEIVVGPAAQWCPHDVQRGSEHTFCPGTGFLADRLSARHRKFGFHEARDSSHRIAVT